MRITDHQKNMLIEATHKCFGDSARVWLFGSRADDSKFGGDVDIYIETDLTEGIVPAKLKFFSFIDPAFGEQKIDLVVHRRDLEIKPIHEIAKENGIEL